MRMASPEAATSGTTTAAARRDGRTSGPAGQSTATQSRARLSSPTARMLAPPCTRSIAVGVSCGGSGQPGEHDTAAETPPKTASSATRPTVSGTTRTQRGPEFQTARANRAWPRASPAAPSRYRTAWPDEATPASLTYPPSHSRGIPATAAAMSAAPIAVATNEASAETRATSAPVRGGAGGDQFPSPVVVQLVVVVGHGRRQQRRGLRARRELLTRRVVQHGWRY